MPHTLFALDNIRPDLLMFRAMSTCLILWDEDGDEDEQVEGGGEGGGGVRLTTAWVRSQLPSLLLQGLFTSPLHAAEGRAEAAAAAAAALKKEEEEEEENRGLHRPSASGAKNTVTLDDGDEEEEIEHEESLGHSCQPLAANSDIASSSSSSNSNSNNSNSDGDSNSNSNSNRSNNKQASMSIRSSFQALVCILAGNAWGLALRYAGTSNRYRKHAHHTLLAHFLRSAARCVSFTVSRCVSFVVLCCLVFT